LATEKQSSARSMRLIDFHVHLRHPQPWRYPELYGLSAEQLIDRMDREGIDRSVLLPLESPEAAEYLMTDDVVAARDCYPERFIAFVCIDPRRANLQERIAAYVEKYDCKGFGELKNELDFDEQRNEAIYEVCNHYELPLVFHMDPTLCCDHVGLPCLEKMAQKYDKVKFVGHGPGFWSAISGDDDRTGGYPSGPIKPGGALDRLMGEYDNVYGEFSAGSGHNALTRDPQFTEGFIERNHEKLMFGTDFLQAGQKLPQVEWLASLDIPIEWRQQMAYGNAERILRIA